MIDKTDRKLFTLLQKDCALSLQALADAVNLTTTPYWKRLKNALRMKVLLWVGQRCWMRKYWGLSFFVSIKTRHHNSDGYNHFVSEVTQMPEVPGFWRMAGEYDYLMRVQIVDIKRDDDFYKLLVNNVPGLGYVTSSFAMEQIKYTTVLPIE